MERVICPEDISDATVTFTHFADEADATEDDYYEVKGKGVVLGIEDSHYVIFTSRCALDFTWPNHEIRWRDIHGWEDGPPELFNEGIILHGASAAGVGDEFFTYGTTNLDLIRTQQIDSLPQPEPPTRKNEERRQRRNTLAMAREVGDIVTVDRFRGVKGELCDVALLYVPITGESTIRLNHLGLLHPKDAVRGLLAKQAVLFGIEFEFSCAECQKVIAGYRSRETSAFLLGFGAGVVATLVIQSFVQRLWEVDGLVSRGTLPNSKIDPLRRIADAGLKRQILERDRFQCAYARYGMCDPRTCWACIAKRFQIDHILPFSRGGTTVPENLVTSCAACNLSKGAELLSAWLRREDR